MTEKENTSTDNDAAAEPELPRYEFALHRNKAVIFIYADEDNQPNQNIKKLKGAKWSQTNKAWYVPDCAEFRRQLGLPVNYGGKEVLAQIHANNQPALQLLVETLQLKAYSEGTIKTYRNEFGQPRCVTCM